MLFNRERTSDVPNPSLYILSFPGRNFKFCVRVVSLCTAPAKVTLFYDAECPPYIFSRLLGANSTDCVNVLRIGTFTALCVRFS